MSRFGRHFVRIREIKAFERRLLKLLVDRPGFLHQRHEALFRYALAMAQLHLFRTPEGDDVDLAPHVDRLRLWMLEAIVPLVPEVGEPNVEMLREIAPVLALRVDKTRTELLEAWSSDFGPEHLDRELCQKTLALVLGGGGGSGLVHLGVFSLVNELGIVPELIVGSSMGSLLGLLRAIDRTYDPINTALALPKHVDYNTMFKPFTGYSRYGFPGVFHLNLLRVASEIMDSLVGKGAPRFEDLPIRLEVIACGIRTGFKIDNERYEKAAKANPSMNPSSMTRTLRLFFSAVKELSKNPRFLSQVVFGQEDTRSFPVIEAAGFSCAVPGLLHYDIFHDDPETIDPLDELFESQRLLRLCDGGVVNNVPSRVAWESVQAGNIGTRNAFILAADAFAPRPAGSNMIWIPVQQIARPAVLANRPYSDYHKTFRDTPSPLQIVVTSYSKIKTIVETSREQLDPDEPYIRKALEPLPPYGTWRIGDEAEAN